MTSDSTSPSLSPSVGPWVIVPTHPLCFQSPPFLLLEGALLAELLSRSPLPFRQLLQLSHAARRHPLLHLLLQLADLLRVLGLRQPWVGSMQLHQGEGQVQLLRATRSLPDMEDSTFKDTLQLEGQVRYPLSSMVPSSAAKRRTYKEPTHWNSDSKTPM